MKKFSISKWLKQRRNLQVHIIKLPTIGDTIAYKHEAFLITNLFGKRLKKDVSDEDVWITSSGVSISDTLRSNVRTVMISYTNE